MIIVQPDELVIIQIDGQGDSGMKRAEDLRRILEAIDRKSYPAYKDTRGGYRFGSYTLFIEHVQGDPFATPSPTDRPAHAQ